MEQQYLASIKTSKKEELNAKLLGLLCEKKITVEQLIEADKNKQIDLTGNIFNFLGISFRTGKNGVKETNNVSAITLYEYAAFKGDDIAKTNCTRFYLHGCLGEPDLDKALRYCLEAKENNQSRAQLLTKIYLRKEEYDAAKSAFSSYEPVKQDDYIDLLIELCEELTQDDTWLFACDIETKLTIEIVNERQKEKIIGILNRLEQKISQLKEDATELKKVIQQIVHIASKFSHIDDPDIKAASNRILNPEDKNLYKLFIDSLYDEMAQKNRLGKNLANSIKQSSAQTLGGAKYVNELIQNACDAANSDGLQVNFVLTEEYLIFSHNGKSFTLRDIQGLCSYATSDRDKAESDGTIGEKGIGFKSVFNITDNVTIMFGVDKSGFSFNRTHSRWQYDPDNYPWQIIPIWTDSEQVVNIFPDGFNKKEVIFIFKIKNAEIRQEIATHLNALISDSSILLFLNQLSVIRFVDKQANTDIVLCKELTNDQQICTIKKNDVTDSQWLLFKHTYTLNQEEQKTLASKHDIAMKYRQRKTAFIQFAASTDIDIIKKSRDKNRLFCYFSTEVKFQFPFLVSAPVLLNSERAQLLDSSGAKYWNALLVAEIACAQFTWFQQLAQTEQFWQHPLALIAEPSQIVFPDRVSNAETCFKNKFEKALETTKFLRTLSGDGLISVNSKMDIYGFIVKFGNELTKQSCISSDYIEKYRDKLKRLGTTEFDAESIVQQLTSKEFAKDLLKPEINRQVCEFFYNLNSNAVITKLKSIAFILSQNKELKKPDEICEPSDRLRYAIKDLDIKLSLLHPLIESFFRSNDQENQKVKERQTWLRNLGIKKLSVQEIVKAVNAAKNREITIQFLMSVSQRFLPITNETQKEIDKREKELNFLRELKLLTLAANNKKIHTSINRFYLGDDFEPDLPLQKELPKLPVFLSTSEFGKNLSSEMLSHYKKLLKKLGVSETISSENVGHLWDCMIDDKDQFVFTKLLFTIFYNKGDLKKTSQFSELAKTLKDKIKLKITSGNFVKASQCYLADKYQPEYAIQQHADEIAFVTEEYIDNQDDDKNILRWHQFLVELGVRNDIHVSKNGKVYSKDDSYFDYLWNYQGYTAEGKITGDMADNELCPVATKWEQFLSQHKVNYYFEIDFIRKIISTPIFWQVIIKKWSSIYPDCKLVTYSTRFSVRRVVSNIEYLALQSLRISQEDSWLDSLSELYSPALREIVTPIDLKVANLEVQLSEEQIEFFGFKSKLTAEDALKVLLHLQTQTVNEKLLKKIEKVYQHLAVYPESCLQNQEEFSQLKLLNETNQFLQAQQLYAFLIAEQDIQRYTENAAFVKKPHHVSLQEFKTVCRILGIKNINKASLTLNFEPIAEHLNSIFNLNSSVTLIALLVIFKEQGVDHVEDEHIQTQLVKLKSKVDCLVCKPANKITVSYSDIFSQDLRAWLENDILYYKISFDRSTQNAICQQLLQYLDLPIDLTELANVIFDDKDAWLAERGNKISALHQRIVAGLTLMQKVENKKKRACPENEVVENANQKQSFAITEPLHTQTKEADQQKTAYVEEPPAKRAKYSGATLIAASSVSDTSSVSKEAIPFIEDLSEEKSSTLEETTVNQAIEINKKRTFTESGLYTQIVPDDECEESKPKRIKLSETAASSNVIPQMSLISPSAIMRSSVFLEKAEQRPDLIEFDNPEESQQVTINTKKTNSPVVFSSSNAVSDKVLPQSFFGSQVERLAVAKPAKATTGQNRTATQEAADKQQGRSAEEYVFEKLKAKYRDQEKYQDFDDTIEDGFKVSVTKKKEDGTPVTVTKHLIWHNKKGESKSHFDMTFTTYDGLSQAVIKKQIIEIKSNAGTNVQKGVFSEPEMTVLETEENYIIWHVGNIRDIDHAFDRKIKNPKQLIEREEIRKQEEKVVKTTLDFSAIYQKDSQDTGTNEQSSQVSSYISKPNL